MNENEGNNTPAPDAGGGETDEVNFGGDAVQHGILKNRPDVQEDLRWWYRYAHIERKPTLSQAEAARDLGVDTSTYNKVFRGEYKNSLQLVLAPPAIMLSRIRVLREQERENTKELNKGRVMTPTVDEIHQVCRKAWRDRQVAIIFGESHIGKTEALLWFRDENNHGSSIYVDLQGVMGVQDIYRAFAKALKLSADVPMARLIPRVLAAIDRTNLVIVDEFHHITYSYRKGSSNVMVNAIKSIKDRTGCGMVICATNVARDEFTEGTGKEAKLLKQLWRRGVIKLQLADALPVGDVRAFAAAYKLDFPAEPETGADTWKALRAAHPEFAGLEVCEHAAYHDGLLALISLFRDAGALAKKRGRDLSWKHVADVQAIYDRRAAKKTV